MRNRVNVTKSLMPPFEEYIDEIRSIWDSHWLTNMGEKHQQLEKELTEYLQVSRMELMTNGHMALELALQAFDLQGEVITTPFTFASTTHAIVRNQLTPVFCDINDDDFTIDVTKIESLITNKTCAILPVHVYGNISAVEEIQKIADAYGLKVIYDAAHAFGEIYKGVAVGTFGDASMFSFHATKVFNTIEGGGVCFSDEKIGEKLARLKNFGICDDQTVDAVGANAKMNEFEAAMGLCNLRHVQEEIAKRRNVYSYYHERLKEVEGIRIHTIQENVTSNYAYFPIIVDERAYGMTRDELCERLKARGIYARKYFYPLTNQFSCYKDCLDAGVTPVAEQVANAVLTLPMHGALEQSELDLICDTIVHK